VIAPFILCMKEMECVRGVELLGIAAQMGGKFHLMLNMGGKPIANKYREGKMKSTLKRE
jgi:hypothetical protein